MKTDKKLVRSSNNYMIAGVCAGIANFFGLDISIVRIAALAMVPLFGTSILVYIALWYIIPLESNNKTI